MTSSDCARAGAASALKPISRKSALNKSSRGRTTRGGIDPRSLPLGRERPSLRDFGSVLVGVFAQLDDLGEILPRLGGIAGLLGGLRGSDIGPETIGLLLARRLEGGQRFRGPAAVEQHRAVELARRYRHARRHRMLLGLVLGVGGRAHGLERVLVFALGMEHPGGRYLRLDIDLFRPVGILG